MSRAADLLCRAVKGQIATKRAEITKYLCLVFDADSAVSSGPGARGQ